MSSRYGVFCVVLFIVVLALGFKNYEIWSFPAGGVTKREVPKRPDSKPEAITPAAPQREIQPREGFKVIAEKNIFNPDRKEFPSVAAMDQSRVSVRPQITLYGVVVSGDFQSATIVNPGRPLQKGEREPKTVKVGDAVGDYKVSKILEDRIVMSNEADSYEILLYDPSAPKKRIEAKTPTQPVTVTSATGGPAPGPAPAPGATPGAGIPQPVPSISPARPATMGGPSPLSAQPAIPSPQPGSPGVASPSTGPTMQPSAPQPSSSGTTPTPGIWRGRRPMQSGSSPTTQGN